MRNLSLILSFFLLLFLSGTAFGQNQEVMAYVPEKTDLAKAITVYPNPAIESVNIKLSTLEATTTKITVYTILGTEVQVEKEIINSHEVKLKVKDLSSGYYLIAVRDEQLQFKATYKFLKR